MIAIDTNLLVHAHRQVSSLHEEAKDCIVNLAENPAPWGICFHSMVEFYSVVTNTRIWDIPSTPLEAKDQIDAWRESPSLQILTDSAGDLELLMELATQGKVQGAMIHDARIANCCIAHGVRELWTIDRDFSRFKKLKTKNPLV